MPLSQSQKQDYREITLAAAKGSISKAEAGERLLRLYPDFGMGYVYLAAAKQEAGVFEGTDELLWRAIEGMPCDFAAYLSLSELLLKLDSDDPVGHRLRAMALWKLSLAEEISPPIAAIFADDPPGTGEPEDPDTYRIWARSYEQAHRSDSPEADDRVLPFQLLTNLQREATGVLSSELLRTILDNPTRCAPVWLAALREVVVDPHVISPEAIDYAIALLGEQGGPEALPDLLPISQSADLPLFLHTQWAIWRVGQRFPAETLATFRAATAGASLPVRYTIAEQIQLLPETPGIRAALVNLLEGFSEFAAHDDAPHLLISVTQGLTDLSYDHEATRLRKLYMPLLPDSGRQEVREHARNPELFELMLLSYNIPETNIDSICLEGVFQVGEEEDDEDIEEEDEDVEEDEEPAPPKVKPDRNGPCWCGSGKKYKKCHLQADEEGERAGASTGQKPEGISLYETVQRRLFESIGEVRSRSEIREAHLLYFGKPVEHFDPTDLRAGAFYEWSMLDFRPGGSGRTVLEEYLRRRPRLPEGERAALESWRAARFSLFEIVRIEHGKGLELRDVFTRDQMFVRDIAMARSFHRDDSLLVRVQQMADNWIFTGDGMKVSPATLPKLQGRVEEEAHAASQSPADFMRSNSHRIHRFLDEIVTDENRRAHIVTSEGDAIEFSSATYRVNDEKALAGALASAAMFEETTPREAAPDRRTFAWFETGAADGPRRTFGRIEIHDLRLVLECNSRRRLSVGRQLLEKHAAQFLTHESDSFRQPGL